MAATSNDQYVARCIFQQDLDRAFPQGAMCAVLPTANGHLRTAEWAEGTGRVFCSDARRVDETGGWLYELLIDTRTRLNRPRHELRFWVGALTSLPSMRGLWEAPITDGDGERVLRLNAEPPPAAKPTPAMRSAITRIHEDDLFPEGLGS